MLGKIYATLRDYKGLPEGIGEGFFRHMTPENALRSYIGTLKIAEDKGDARQAEDLRYRIALMKWFEHNIDALHDTLELCAAAFCPTTTTQ